MSVRTRSAWRALAALLGAAAMVAVSAEGCAGTVADSPPGDGGGRADAGDDADAEAGPPLQCWCGGFGDGSFASDHPGPDYVKCAPGWICGQYPTLHPGASYCCEPLDEGIPNCYDTTSDRDDPPDVTPNGLTCKLCSGNMPCQ